MRAVTLILIALAAILTVLLVAGAAQAAAGDITVTVTEDASGDAVGGALVRVILDGGDGTIDSSANPWGPDRTNDKVIDLTTDASGVATAVRGTDFSSTAGTDYAISGAEYMVAVELEDTGFARKQTSPTSYNQLSENQQQSATLLTSLKVTAKDERGTTLTGVTVTVTDGSTSQAVTDGLAGDQDGAANGVVQVAANPGSFSGAVTVTTSLTGYVSTSETKTLTNQTQETVADSANPFRLKVTVSDELGNALTSGVAVTHGGTAPAVVAGATHYFTTTTAGALAVAKDGFVNLDTTVDTGLGSVSTNAADATVVTLSGTTPYTGSDPQGTSVTGSGLKFTVKVIDFVHEGGGTVVITTAGLDSDNGQAGEKVDGAIGYLPMTAQGLVTAIPTGYVHRAVEVTPSSTSQTTVSFGDPAADVDGGALLFRLKVLTHDELGNEVTGAAVRHADTAAAHTDGAAHYFTTTSIGDLNASKSGYITVSEDTDSGLAAIGTTTTEQTVVTLSGTTVYTNTHTAGDDITASGLKFALKVVVKDELGNDLSGATVTHATTAAAQTVGAVHYFSTNTTGALTAEAAGYVDLDTSVDTGLAAVDDTDAWDQTIITLSGTTAYTGSHAEGADVTGSGLKFTIKVLVQDELGNDLDDASVTHGTNASDAVHATNLHIHYIAAVDANPLAVSQSGYVDLQTSAGNDIGLTSVVPVDTDQTVVTLSGTTPYTGTHTGGGAIAGSGLKFTVKVLSMKDELGNAVTINAAGLDASSGGAGEKFSGGVGYIPMASAGTVTAQPAGFVHNTVSVTPSSAQQTTVAFGDSGAGADVEGGALLYRLKVITKDELGNALNGVTVTHGGAAVTVSGNAHYIKSTAAAAIAASKTGYVSLDTSVDTGLASVTTSTTSQTIVTLNGTTPYTGDDPVGTSVMGSGLKHTLVVHFEDAVGNAVHGGHVLFQNPGFPTGDGLAWNLSDGGADDLDGEADGVGYFAINPSSVNTEATLNATRLGFVNSTTVTTALSDSTQTSRTFVLQHTISVTAVDELGLTRILGAGNTSFALGGTLAWAPGEDVAFGDDGTAYLPLLADGGTGTITLGHLGFLNATSAVTVTPSNASADSLSFASSTALKYAVAVLAVETEFGEALTLTGSPFSNTTNDISRIVAQNTGPLGWYVAATPGGLNLTLALDGYITQTVELTVTNASRRTTDFDQGSPGSGSGLVDGPGLPYAIRIATLEDELGNNILTGTDTAFKLDGADALGTHWDGTNWYLAASPGSVTLVANVTGYVNATTPLTITDTAQSVVHFDAAAGNADALPFLLKVVVHDELGNALAGATVTHDGTAPAATSGNAYYFTTGAGDLAVSLAGYVDLDAVVDTGLGSFGTTSDDQTTVTLTGITPYTDALAPGADVTGSGLKFLLKVAVHDELGNPLTDVSVTHGPTAPVITDGHVHYFTTTAAGTLGAEREGFLGLDVSDDAGLSTVSTTAGGQTVVTLSGTTPYTGSDPVGGSVTGSGLAYTIRIDAIEDQLGNAITIDAADIVAPADVVLDGGKAYLNLTHDATITIARPGFLPSSAVVGISPTTQMSVRFGGTGSLLDAAPLTYRLRVDVTEAWDGDALAGATVDVYSDNTLTTLAGTATTDANGRAYLAVTGSIWLVVTKAGHLTNDDVAAALSDSAQSVVPIEVAGILTVSGESLDATTAQRTEKVRLTFTITYPDGTPVTSLSGTTVDLLFGGNPTLSGVADALTSPDGAYTFAFTFPVDADVGTWTAHIGANGLHDAADPASMGPATAVDAGTVTLEAADIVVSDLATDIAVAGPGDTVTVSFTAAYPDGTAATGLTGDLTVTDGDGATRTIALTESGGTYTAALTVAVGDPTGAWTFALPVDALTDAHGNAGPAAEATTTADVDTSAPVTTVMAPATTNTGGVTVTVAVDEAGAADVDEVRLWADTGDGTWVLVATLDPAEGLTHTYTFTGEGVVRFAASSNDTVGNAEALPTGAGDGVAVTYDGTLPASAVSPLPDLTEGDVTVHWNATDAGDAATGVASVEVQVSVNGGEWTPWLTTDVLSGNAAYTEGAHGDALRFRTIATDVAGNAEAAPTEPDATTKVVRSPPMAGLDEALDGAVVGGEVGVVYNADAEALEGWTLEVRPQGGAFTTIAEGTTAAAGAIALWDTTGLADGVYGLRLTVRDATGLTDTAQALVTVDNTAPTATLTGPSGYWLANGTLTFEVTADDGSGVDTVELWFSSSPDNETFTEATRLLEDAAGTVQVDLPDGHYRFHVVAVDTVGNARATSGTPDAIHAVDTQAPNLTVLSPPSGPLAGQLLLAANATDNGTLVTVQVVAGDASTTLDLPLGTLSRAIASDTFPDGNRVLMFIARDAARNEATRNVTIRIDNSAPAITAPALEGLPTLPPGTTVRLTLADASGVANATVRIDGQVVASGPGGTLQFAVPALAAGEHVVEVVAIDTHGNTGNLTATFVVPEADEPGLLKKLTPGPGALAALAAVGVAVRAFRRR